MNSEVEAKLRVHYKNYLDGRLNKDTSPTDQGHEQQQDLIRYGTSGFRGLASQIDHLFYNIGLIAAVRSLHLKSNVGVMITASHNPIEDNGVKLIDSNGEMLDMNWEPIVEEFCNSHDIDSVIDQLKKLIEIYHISTTLPEKPYQVLVGMDTRPSSEALSDLVKKGIEAWSPLVSYSDYNQVTTPALHYLVGVSNQQQRAISPIRAYYDQLIDGLVDIFSRTHEEVSSNSYSALDLIVDCANGVGSETMTYLCSNEAFTKYLPVNLINTGTDGILNKMCGADYVKTTLNGPSGATCKTKRYAALDGDADRLIYFYFSSEKGDDIDEVNILDGDKIMALLALYLKEALRELNLEQELSFGIVQTAYANGASTDYLMKELNLKVDCVDTGVKNLHKKVTQYDLGLYFESNGHGTVWASSRARELIEEKGHDSNLKRFLSIINSFTGDAISDILAVEVVLRHYGWDIKQWYAIYSDRPNVLLAEKVPNRLSYKTTNAGRTLVEPIGLQEDIDTIVSKYGANSRCFVRASGTEDKVRIYCEAETQELVSQLSQEVRKKILNQTGE